MSVTLQWLGHASFRICCKDVVLYIDPWKLKEEPHDATVVLVSHSHYDHYSPDDVKKVSGPDTRLVAPGDVVATEGRGKAITPGSKVEEQGVSVMGVPAYNHDKAFHPKSKNWLGFIIEICSKRIYYAGDTDKTEEMKAIKDIDVALLPVGGTYTMNAAEAVAYFKPKMAIPYHWGDIVGGEKDAKEFSELCQCEANILRPGETFNLE